MTIWVTPEQVLEGVGAATSVPPDWAQACADAVNAGLDRRLIGADVDGTEAELILCARFAGTEAYKRKEATFGLTGFVDLQGAAIRVARDYLEAQAPIIARYATLGLA